jgi:spermidine synthase
LRTLFILLYTVSGAAALVYEVVWTRLLTLQLGHTVAAASTVLAAFMGGLAVGAWIAGRVSQRKGLRAVPDLTAYLRLYVALEIGTALCALLLPATLKTFVPALAWAYADGTAPARLAVVRVAISLAVLGVPAAAMGATFPIAAQWWAETARHPAASAADAGVLYAANTAGAAGGAITAGFLLIPSLGLRSTTWVGVGLNLLAASGAWWLAVRPTAHAAPAEIADKTAADSGSPQIRAPAAAKSAAPRGKKEPARPPRSSAASRSPDASVPIPPAVLACTAVGISGFTALVYEVAWTRLLALVVGPTTYAFATMAAAFISGLAIGSALGTRIARRTPRPVVWLAVTLAVGGIAAVAAASYAATRMPLVIAAQVADAAVAFPRVVIRQAVGVTFLLFPMTIALGATFPFALAVAGGHAASVGRDVSRVYTANTIGAIAGALAAGFVLIPQVGLQATFTAAAVLAALTGAVCLGIGLRIADRGLRIEDRGSRLAKSAIHHQSSIRHQSAVRNPQSAIGVAGAAALLAVGAIAALPAWDRDLLASGGYKYAPYVASGDLETALRAGHLEYYKEGAAATVSVRRLTGTLSMAIDGKVDASNGGDMLTQRLLGLLPVVLHGRATDVCIIGLGSGVTAGSALLTGTVRQADVVEISPEVVEASRFFERENRRALSQPGVRLIVGDGRSHLLLSRRQYDVIISEPSNPWMAGIATLFTREFFEAARRRLKPEGLLCQWAHTYDISPEDLKSIVHTFASVFPQGTMWLVGEGDLLLIGTNGSNIEARLDRLRGTWAAGPVLPVLEELGIDPAAASFNLLSLLAGGPRELAQYGGDALIQTDDGTALEYSAPRSIYGRNSGENAAAIRTLAVTLPPPVRAMLDNANDALWTSRGRMLLKAEAFGLAYEAFQRAVSLNRRNSDALAGLSDAAAGAHRDDEAREWLKGLAAREPGNVAVRIELSRQLAATGDFEGSIAAVQEALRLAPEDPRAGEQLASVLADAGDAERLASLADALTTRFPDRPNARYYRASALFLGGRTEEAIREAERVIDRAPLHARAQNLLGAACATLGRRECALAAFEASIRANPRDPSTYVNLGMLHLQYAEPRSAAAAFAEALAIDPASAAARNGLAQARSLIH